MSSLNSDACAFTFHQFNQLPEELKSIIWKYAIDAVGPRVIKFHLVFFKTVYDNTGQPVYLYENRSRSPIPEVLHVCPTSRQLALKRWRLSFSVSGTPAEIFFDFDQDILWWEQEMMGIWTAVTLSQEERDAVRRVAWSFDPIFSGSAVGYQMAAVFRRWVPNTAEIVIVEADPIEPVSINHIERCDLEGQNGDMNPLLRKMIEMMEEEYRGWYEPYRTYCPAFTRMAQLDKQDLGRMLPWRRTNPKGPPG